ncbi:hypothetical protein [Streptomyces sp. NPDC007369]|uniref:hypothetical protein n=1 Tax=Streptomyces sp. NPDC007369 TaxID=3154589 RepID=UPI0033C2DDE6
MINAAFQIGSDVRMFQQDRLLCINTAGGNRITYNNPTTGHGTFAKVPQSVANRIDGAYLIGDDVRLFHDTRLVVVDVSNGNGITFDGAITDHGTYKQVPQDFADNIDDVIQIGNDTRMFKGHRLVVVNTAEGNAVTYDGEIKKHGTFAKLPNDFDGDFDAVHTIGDDIRFFRGNRLVIINYRQGNAITYDGPAREHGTYGNVPSSWLG